MHVKLTACEDITFVQWIKTGNSRLKMYLHMAFPWKSTCIWDQVGWKPIRRTLIYLGFIIIFYDNRRKETQRTIGDSHIFLIDEGSVHSNFEHASTLDNFSPKKHAHGVNLAAITC